MLRRCLIILALAIMPFAAARSAEPITPPASDDSPATSQPMPQEQDLISFGAGATGWDKDQARTHATDFRLEYRFGTPLLPSQNSWLAFGINPLVGGETSTRGQLYGFGGLAFDLLFWKHFVFTESEAVGLFDSGNARPLGSVIEFRSQAEVGWRFDNDMRLTGFIGHISNAGLTHRNPGEELVGGYLHIPVNMIFGG